MKIDQIDQIDQSKQSKQDRADRIAKHNKLKWFLEQCYSDMSDEEFLEAVKKGPQENK